MLLSNLNLLAQAPNGVARLRELILTLAVQGKLVPQDPTDEPASELLKKIRAEKDRLIAEGKIKRDKPLAEIGEEEKPFGLPSGWQWVPLQHIGYTQTGTTPDKKNSQMYGGSIPFIKPGDIYPNHVDYDNEALSPEGLQDSGRVAPAGSLLMVCIGTIGKSNLITKDCSFNQQINSVTPLCSSPEFVKLYCRSPFFQGEAWARSSSTTIAILNKGKWEAIPFALPPLAEQSRIVTRVEELMRLCDALEAKGQLEATQHAQLVTTLLGTLSDSETPVQLADNWHRIATHFDLLLDRPEAVDALEQTILQLAVRGLLVPQDPQDEPASALLKKIRVEKDQLIAEGKIKRDKPLPPIAEDEQPFALPQGWEWVRLRDLVTHLGDGLHGTPNYSLNGDYYFVNGNNLGAGVITIKPETKRVDHAEFEKHRKPLDSTTVLLSINGTLGRVAFYQNEMVVLGKSACYFNVTVGLQKIFAKLLLECPDFMAYAEKSATGTTIKNLGLKAIGDWPIALPPLAEQSRIVTRVAQLRRLCADLRQRLTASQSTQSHLAEALVDTVALGLPVA
jgi:type I restriction enzyme S subunit